MLHDRPKNRILWTDDDSPLIAADLERVVFFREGSFWAPWRGLRNRLAWAELVFDSGRTIRLFGAAAVETSKTFREANCKHSEAARMTRIQAEMMPGGTD